MSECPKCGFEFDEEEEDVDYIQELADELIEKIVADMEVKEVPVSCYPRGAELEESVCVDNFFEMPSALPTSLRGLRRTGECCFIVHEDMVPFLQTWSYGWYHGVFSESEEKKDYFGVPIMTIGKYRVCHTPSKCLSSVTLARDDSREESVPVAVFGNLEEYRCGDKKAVVKLVFPKRESHAARVDLPRKKRTLLQRLRDMV